MTTTRDPGPRANPAPVEKLVEYRRAHYAAHSEAASYFTNTPAQVQFRFSNPIICELKSGFKIMRVGGSDPFEFFPGDVLYVPPGLEIDVDLNAARSDKPIECDCIEIELERMNNLLARLNENMSQSEHESSIAVNWSAFSVLPKSEARQLDFGGLMGLFRGTRDVFSDLDIDNRIDATLLSLLKTRRRTLLTQERGVADTGLHAAARLIRHQLDRHVPICDLARAACMSESSLHRHFRKHFGTSPARYANQLRITQGKEMLRKDDAPVEEIAFRLGFSDASHFTRVFRKTTGEAPVEYRNRRRKPAAFEN